MKQVGKKHTLSRIHEWARTHTHTHVESNSIELINYMVRFVVVPSPETRTIMINKQRLFFECMMVKKARIK